MTSWIKMAPRTAAWVLFAAVVALTLAIDHRLRMRDGDILTGGLPEYVYAGLPLIAAAISLGVIWRATSNYRSVILRVVELLAHAAVGYCAYMAVLLYYVLGNGIDTL